MMLLRRDLQITVVTIRVCGAQKTGRRYAKMLEIKSRNRLAYCSGWTVEISAPAWKTQTCWWLARAPCTMVTPPPHTHPMLDCFGCVSGFFLGVVLGEDVNQTH